MIRTLKKNAIPFILIAISIIFLIDINSVENAQAIGLVFPRIIVILLLISSLSLIIKSIIFEKKETNQEEESAVTLHWPVLISFLAYIIFLNVLGFFICTPIFVFIVAKLFKIKTWHALLTSTLLSMVIYLLFVKVLFVPFPLGVWIFKDINRFIIY